MEFREYLLLGEKAAGGRTELAVLLDQKGNAITDAKAHRRGLPVYACVELAKLINVDPMEVIAASELVTEKKETRIAVFRPFIQAARHAHLAALAPMATLMVLSTTLGNSLLIARDLLL